MAAKNTYKIRIDHPCGQDWNAMQPEGQSRFCANCQKSVTDFIYASDAEILRKIEETGGSLCGRFTPSQMNRNLVPPFEKSARPNLYRWVAGFVLAAGISNSQVKAETTTPVSISAFDRYNETGYPNEEVDGIAKTGRTIEGKVIDESGKPISDATVWLRGLGVASVTDSMGIYSIMVPDTVNTNSLVVQVSSTGFFEVDTIIDTHMLPLQMNLTLKTKELEIYVLGRIAPPPIQKISSEPVIIEKVNRYQRVRNTLRSWYYSIFY
jgi:hypothetical protein